MSLPDSFMQELKARSDIVSIVSGYVHLKRRGRNMIGLCPFHGEKTPSFNLYPESGSFYCFGCGAGGDVITFIRKIENLDYIEAVKFLSERAGLEVPLDNQDQGIGKAKTRIYEANRAAARYYHQMLYSPVGAQALSYLRGRGLSEKTIKHFGLGYAPGTRFALVDFLKAKGFQKDELIGANLAFSGRTSNLVDRFYDRVMFPIIDLRGNVIAFGGRVMGDAKPKYLNTSDTIVFQKNANLFALNFAKNAGKEQLILAEGYMDVIALHQAGFQNTVATLGTSLTKEQTTILSRYASEIVIAYDADQAGQKATKRAISMFRDTGLLVRVLTIPSGKDPDEFIRSYKENGAIRFQQLLNHAENDIEYTLQKIRLGCDLSLSEGKVKYLTEASEWLAALPSKLEREVYASKLSEEIGVEKSSIMLQIEKLVKKQNRDHHTKKFREIEEQTAARRDEINPERGEHLRAAHAEEALLGFVINNPQMAHNIFSRLSPDQFSTTFNRRVYHALERRIRHHQSVDLTDLSQEFSMQELSRIAKILSSYLISNNQSEAVEEYIRVVLQEKNKIDQKKAATADIEDLKKYVEELKKLKK